MWSMVLIPSIIIISFYIFVQHQTSFTSLYWKSAASVSFLMVALQFINISPGTYQTWMFVGLLLGALGDVLLALPFCYPKKEPILFLSGLISFLLGHLCYVRALFHTTGNQTLTVLVLSMALGGGLVLLLKNRGVNFKEMLVPAMLYAMVIMLFELQCVSWLVSSRTMFSILVNIGSLLFVISDFILVFIVFANRKERSFTIANLTTYYTAQLCLVTTFLFF